MKTKQEDFNLYEFVEKIDKLPEKIELTKVEQAMLMVINKFCKFDTIFKDFIIVWTDIYLSHLDSVNHDSEMKNFKEFLGRIDAITINEYSLIELTDKMKKFIKFDFTPLSEGLIKTYGKLDENNEAIDKNFHWPLVISPFDETEKSAMRKVINSDQFTMGSEVRKFEREFAKYFGVNYAIMTNSGSSANLLAVAAMMNSKRKIQFGRDIIVPAIAWSTTYAPLTQYGIRLKFVDVDLRTLNYDLKKLKRAINANTKALMIVNLLGNPNDYRYINEEILENRDDIFIIEDNCEAIGAKCDNIFSGTFGHLGTFSFYYSHQMSTIEGGMVTTNYIDLYNIMLSLRSHGWTREYHLLDQDSEFPEDFSFKYPGYNLRPTEFSGAIGRIQMLKLKSNIERRRKNAKLFVKLFKESPYFIIQKEIGESSWFGFSLIVKEQYKRNGFLKILKKNRIEYRPIASGNFLKSDCIKYFHFDTFEDYLNADLIDKKGFFIGNHSRDLTNEIETLWKILHE